MAERAKDQKVKETDLLDGLIKECIQILQAKNIVKFTFFINISFRTRTTMQLKMLGLHATHSRNNLKLTSLLFNQSSVSWTAHSLFKNLESKFDLLIFAWSMTWMPSKETWRTDSNSFQDPGDGGSLLEMLRLWRWAQAPYWVPWWHHVVIYQRHCSFLCWKCWWTHWETGEINDERLTHGHIWRDTTSQCILLNEI